MDLYTENDYARRSGPTNERPGDPRSAFRRDYARVLHSPAFRRLQGKMQLFPGFESDFFRNRLTHSLEVAQIANSLARHLNSQEAFFAENPIDCHIVETAALAHDIGHPPFAHNGEQALDALMKGNGGFEGNAQTLRILARLEKKASINPDNFVAFDTNGEDQRLGLDLTYRSLAAVVKYEKPISAYRDKDDGMEKGYYGPERGLIQEIRSHVLGAGEHASDRPLYTIECSIMDLADDIAYSTYDLEDALKGRLINPLDFFQAETEILERVAHRVHRSLQNNPDSDSPSFNSDDVLRALVDIFGKVARQSEDPPEFEGELTDSARIAATSDVYRAARDLGDSGYLRTEFTSQLVHQFVTSARVVVDEDCPPLSRAYLPEDQLVLVEVLKHLTYEMITCSPRLKVTQYRGKNIVRDIFKSLDEDTDGGADLLPDDFRRMHEQLKVADKSGGERQRVLCDFIAGMTDRYAVEYFGRLKSEHPQTMFHPF